MADVDLTTLTIVRERRGTTASNTTQNTMVERVITNVSRAIIRHCQREFAPATASAARVFEYDENTHFLSVAPYDLRSVSSVQIDTDEDSPVTLTDEEYRLWPRPTKDGTYHGLRLDPLGPGRGRWPYRQVTITGAWGFASVPTDVEEAATIAVIHNLRTQVGVYAVSGDTGETRFERALLPQASLDLLAPFKRYGYA